MSTLNTVKTFEVLLAQLSFFQLHLRWRHVFHVYANVAVLLYLSKLFCISHGAVAYV
jgi:hypothetical protein